jgi:hypothetical protein
MILEALKKKESMGRGYRGRDMGAPMVTARSKKPQPKLPTGRWYEKAPTVAGEANRPGSACERLCHPSNFTGMYRWRQNHDEWEGGAIGDLSENPKQTRELLINKHIPHGKAADVKAEVAWLLNLRPQMHIRPDNSGRKRGGQNSFPTMPNWAVTSQNTSGRPSTGASYGNFRLPAM